MRTVETLRRLVAGAIKLAALLFATGKRDLAVAAQQRAAWLRVELIRARAFL